MNNIQETSRRQKAIQSFLGTNSKVMTFGIITAENPMYQQRSSRENEERNIMLVNFFRSRQYIYFPVTGKFDANEHSFMVYNVTLDDMKIMGRTFDQESFIFAEIDRSEEIPKIKFSYYEKPYSEDMKINKNGKKIKPKDRDYYLKDTSDISCNLDKSTENYFTAIGRNFKFVIPFSVFNEAITRFDDFVNERCDKHPLYNERCMRNINESIDPNRTSRGRFVNRAKLYGDNYELWLKN